MRDGGPLTNAFRSINLGFASAAAEFGMLLLDSPFRADASFESVLALARAFKGNDEEGYRAQFIELVEPAAMLRDQQTLPVLRR